MNSFIIDDVLFGLYSFGGKEFVDDNGMFKIAVSGKEEQFFEIEPPYPTNGIFRFQFTLFSLKGIKQTEKAISDLLRHSFLDYHPFKFYFAGSLSPFISECSEGGEKFNLPAFIKNQLEVNAEFQNHFNQRKAMLPSYIDHVTFNGKNIEEILAFYLRFYGEKAEPTALLKSGVLEVSFILPHELELYQAFNTTPSKITYLIPVNGCVYNSAPSFENGCVEILEESPFE